MKFINKYLRNLAPYKVASQEVWEASDVDRKLILKLDWNESTIPPSPKVKERLIKLVENENIYFLYPSTNNQEILYRLSLYNNLPLNNVQYFASSDTLHEYLVRMYISVRDPILILGPTYDNFRLTCQSQGADLYYFNYPPDFKLNEQEFINKIQVLSPSLVYICNPNNPSGTLLCRKFLKKLISQFSDVIFLIDEAYFEFSKETLAKEVIKFSNLFISRTFSKAFGLANFRVGYLISHIQNIQQISKIRNPKNVTTFAQEAVLGALSDIEYMENYVAQVIKAREFFSKQLEKVEFINQVLPSEANFVLVEFKNIEWKIKTFDYLRKKSVFVRNLMHSESLINTLRITVGTESQMKYVLKLIKELE